MEHILATTNESRLCDKVSSFSQHFQDCINWPFESTFMVLFYLFFCFIVDISGSEKCCIQSNCYQKKSNIIYPATDHCIHSYFFLMSFLQRIINWFDQHWFFLCGLNEINSRNQFQGDKLILRKRATRVSTYLRNSALYSRLLILFCKVIFLILFIFYRKKLSFLRRWFCCCWSIVNVLPIVCGCSVYVFALLCITLCPF